MSRQRIVYTNDGATITASGVSDPVTLAGGTQSSDGYRSRIRRAWLTVYVKGSVSGTTPSMTVTYEQQDGLGNYITIAQLTALTAAGYVTALLGETLPLTDTGRIRWTVTGTTPSFGDTDITLVGLEQ